MNKLIITSYNNKILEALYVDGKLFDLMLFDRGSILDNIYIGKVEKVVSNIDACFVDIGTDIPCYYSIYENNHIFINDKKDDTVKEGDELLVQVVKDGKNTKNPVASAELSLRGEYVIVNTSGQVGISAKLKDKEVRNHLHGVAKRALATTNGFGCVIRTSAGKVAEDEFVKELDELACELNNIINKSKTRTCFSNIYKPKADYLEHFLLRNNQAIDEIVCDDEVLTKEFADYISSSNGETAPLITHYTDTQITLSALHNLNKDMESLTKKIVYLKSGAYLVIEQTEAMVVVDVNTGKSVAKKSLNHHMLDVNKEAAVEVARQMRLRNLSGIIMVDFINMKKKGATEELASTLQMELAKDAIPAKLVDVTKLGLFELTRKRIKRPLAEVLKD